MTESARRAWHTAEADLFGASALAAVWCRFDDEAASAARLAAHFGRLALGQTTLIVEAGLPTAEDVLGIFAETPFLGPGYWDTPRGG